MDRQDGTALPGGGATTLGGETAILGGGTPVTGCGMPFCPIPVKFNHRCSYSNEVLSEGDFCGVISLVFVLLSDVE